MYETIEQEEERHERDFEKLKLSHRKDYDLDDSRFKWRYFDCADGFVFCLDGKEYTNLKELKDDINKLL